MREQTVGSKLIAQVYPLSATNFVSYQWKADEIPISGETTETLSLTSDLSNKRVSVEVKPCNSNVAYHGVGTSKTLVISSKELKTSTFCIVGLIIGLILNLINCGLEIYIQYNIKKKKKRWIKFFYDDKSLNNFLICSFFVRSNGFLHKLKKNH